MARVEPGGQLVQFAVEAGYDAGTARAAFTAFARSMGGKAAVSVDHAFEVRVCVCMVGF
jgi:hypothetical protein